MGEAEQKAATAGAKVSFDVAKFQDSFDDGKTRHGFKSLKAPLGVRKMPSNELHAEHWRLEDSDHRVFEGKKTAMDTENYWVMMPVEGNSVKLVPVSKWYNFTQQMTGKHGEGEKRSLEQAEIAMNKVRTSEKQMGETLVKKLNPGTEPLEEDSEPAGSDIYGIKEAERRRQAKIANKARPEGYKAEMDVVDSASQLVNIRADKEGAWDFDDGAEYSDDEGDDGQLCADDKEGIADNVEDEPDLLAANSTDSEAEGEEPEELMTAQGKDFVRALKGEQNAVLDSELAELGLEEEEEEEGRTSPTSVPQAASGSTAPVQGVKRGRSEGEGEPAAKSAKAAAGASAGKSDANGKDKNKIDKDKIQQRLLEGFRRSKNRMKLKDVLSLFHLKTKGELYKNVVEILKQIADVQSSDGAKICILRKEYYNA